MRKEMVIDNRLMKINFSPETEDEEIIQNIRYILSTLTTTLPLDRDFAFDHNLIDKPNNFVKNQIFSELFQKIKKYEPRVKLKKVHYDTNLNGEQLIKVEVVKNG